MAFYIETDFLKPGKATNKHWTDVYRPGDTVAVSGIYRCTGCGKERALNAGDPATTQNHHQHAAGLPPIRWKLIVRAKTD